MTGNVIIATQLSTRDLEKVVQDRSVSTQHADHASDMMRQRLEDAIGHNATLW